MASYDHPASLEPWLLRSADPWLFDAFTHDSSETALVTKALTQSISDSTIPLWPPTPAETAPDDVAGFSSSPVDNALLNAATADAEHHQGKLPETPPNAAGQSFSTSRSGSHPEISAASKRIVRSSSSGKPVPANKRIAKRKPRASKKSPTTFITADAANFRHMVQQITGVKLPPSGSSAAVGSILKPEPQRIGGGGVGGGRIQAAAAAVGCRLPTLDTSALFLDHRRQQPVAHGVDAAPASVLMTAGTKSSSESGMMDSPDTVHVEDGTGAGVGVRGFDFDSHACFPTIESCSRKASF